VLSALSNKAIAPSFIYIDVVVMRPYSKHTAIW
jgi:hypothetical protein